MEEDTWGGWTVVGVVGLLLGWAVGLAADAVTGSPGRSVFLGIMSGIAFVTLGLRR